MSSLLTGEAATIETVFEETDWLTAYEIHTLQEEAPGTVSLPATEWKRQGRIFKVSYNGADYYPRYQFDARCQPLPIIKEILEAYGDYDDAWSVATWFHFPNGWIAEAAGDDAYAIAPKDALQRAADVIQASRNRKGTYVA